VISRGFLELKAVHFVRHHPLVGQGGQRLNGESTIKMQQKASTNLLPFSAI
jgi:hypothetical protein